MKWNKWIYFGGVSSETTQVERPQNGANSHVFPGSTVAQRVLAKHIPGKSIKKKRNGIEMKEEQIMMKNESRRLKKKIRVISKSSIWSFHTGIETKTSFHTETWELQLEREKEKCNNLHWFQHLLKASRKCQQWPKCDSFIEIFIVLKYFISKTWCCRAFSHFFSWRNHSWEKFLAFSSQSWYTSDLNYKLCSTGFFFSLSFKFQNNARWKTLYIH